MRAIQFFLLVGVAMMLASSNNTYAQGRGNGNMNENHGKGHNKEYHPGKGNDKDRYDYDTRDERNRFEYNHYHDSYCHHDAHRYPKRYVTYRHHRSGPPSWAPAYGYRYNTRYIYYRDYNVYYDCHRDVFITWTGRNWAVTTRIPDAMWRVDFRTATVAGIDYWNDDFDFYLERKRPAYVSIQASF
jgi:hypothetical protein